MTSDDAGDDGGFVQAGIYAATAEDGSHFVGHFTHSLRIVLANGRQVTGGFFGQCFKTADAFSANVVFAGVAGVIDANALLLEIGFQRDDLGAEERENLFMRFIF